MDADHKITVCVAGRTKTLHFQIHRLAVAASGLSALALAVAGCAIALGRSVTPASTLTPVTFAGEVAPTRATLLASMAQSRAELESARKEQAALRDEVAQSAVHLHEVKRNLEAVEQLMGSGIVSAGPAPDMHARAASLKLAAMRNAFVLEHIPNGSPVDFKGISSPFGMRAHPITNERRMHEGVDLRADYATPAVATADGIVEFAGYQDRDGYGRLLTVAHDFGFKTNYGHLSSFTVQAGDYVSKGQVIGYTGNSGLSSGPHLHYEISYLQHKLDPAPFLTWSLRNFASVIATEHTIHWGSLLGLAARQAERLAARVADSRATSGLAAASSPLRSFNR